MATSKRKGPICHCQHSIRRHRTDYGFLQHRPCTVKGCKCPDERNENRECVVGCLERKCPKVEAAMSTPTHYGQPT